MAVNPRFEINPNSQDGVSFGYLGAHRGHFGGGPNLERGSSFRENHDGRLVIQGMAGQPFVGSSSSGHGERQPLTQVLALDPISSGEQKYARQLELRRAIIAAMGLQGEAHGNLQPKPLEQQGLEELKRIKASLVDNAARARERSRGFTEATSKLDQYRASLQTRKRVRTEAFVHEQPMTSLSGERLATAGGNSIKATFSASPNHASIADSGTPKPEDKNKGLVPNKRIRTSMVDVRLEGRANTLSLQRSTGLADQDRDSFKTNNSLAGVVEDKDRTVSTAVESWEKTKMKGRRSATKSESVTLATNSTLEVEREHKWGAQHRSSVENRPKLTEGHGFRGPVHGVVSIHKVESAQQNVVPIRPINRNESDGSPCVGGEKGDRLPFPEKEQPSLVKNSVKLPHKEEGHVLSPTTVTKLKAPRGPRSSAAVSVNSSAQYASRPPPSDGWDRAAPGRSQLPVGPINRKRSTASRPSSPPVVQWVGQRPQKMSRVARRMNLVPPTVSPSIGKDETASMGDGNSGHDITATVGARSSASMPAPAGPVRRVASTATISQNKPKIERVTPSMGVSESDDSEGGDLKSKEKWKKHGESEGRFANVSQKMATLVVPGKKSRVGSKEEGGDGVRRQGRSSRGLIAVTETPFVTHVEKVDPAANAKQLRSARPGLDKLQKSADVKPGRPPTKMGIADRKVLTRPRRLPTSSVGYVSGESDDDHEELMAAVQAAVNASAAACPNSFWKEMEPFFTYLTPDEQEGLRKQARELEEYECSLTLLVSDNITKKDIVSPFHMGNESVVATPVDSPVVNAVAKVTCLSNGSMEVDGGGVSKAFNNLKDQHVRGLELQRGWPENGMPLSQRLLAALIIEGDSDNGNREDGSQVEVQGDAGERSFHDLSCREQAQLESKDQDSESEVETRLGDNSKWNGWSKSPSNDDLNTSNGYRHWDSESELLNSPAKADIRKEGERTISNANGLRTWNIQYQTLKLDDRIALELQSVGLYPDLEEIAGVEDDEVAEELKKSHMELKDQIHTNKERLSSLGMVVSNSRATEERQQERLAMLKLVEIAFNKRVGCRGGGVGACGSKSSVSKAARTAALTFAKRTLVRWKHFVETGESCFIDASLRDILFCLSSKGGEEKFLSSSDDQVRASISSVGLSSMGPLLLKSADLDGPGHSYHKSGAEKDDKESSKNDQVKANSAERLIDKDDMWSSRPKEREVLIEDVVGSGNSGNTTLGGTKGKRSERDGKGQGKEFGGRGGDTYKGGRQGLGTIKGERRTKTKLRQRTAPILKAVNGLFGKPQELKEGSPAPLEMPGDRFMKTKDEPLSRKLGNVKKRQQPEAVDLTHLPIPSMDDFVVSGDLEGQGQDLGSWLDFEDPGLPDAGGDLMGLDVPMDDLTDLAMMM